MWAYQHFIQISFKVSAELIFNKIDPNLKPEVFLIGVLVEDRENRHPICIEPEDEVYFSPEDFSGLNDLASQLRKVDSENKIFHSHEIAQKNHQNRIHLNSYVNALSKIIENQSAYTDEKYFVADPTLVDGYLVFTVLKLDNKTIEKYYSLSKNKWNDRYTVFRSFIEASINVFLKECSYALKLPNDHSDCIRRNSNELLRQAGKEFMYKVSTAGGNIEGLHGLYDACNEISSMKYEGSIGLGKIIIAPKDHKNIKMEVEFKESIRFREYRKVRKILELTDEETSIISDSSNIYGLGSVVGHYNTKEEVIFSINFTSHHKWILSHDDNELMEVENTIPSVMSEKISQDKFYKDFPRIFQDPKRKQVDDIWEATSEAIKQKKGALLIVCNNAKQEAERLANQCIPIEPSTINNNTIKKFTSIDGGILIDEKGICYAIGVILDGVVTTNGDSSRGSRYNSAIRYYDYFGKKNSIMIVVVSEDGMINIIPNLKSQIKKSLIEEAINELQGLLKNENISIKCFNRLMMFFKSIKFYLTPEECETINTLREDVHKKFPSEFAMVRIVFEDLKPNSEMNESYYL